MKKMKTKGDTIKTYIKPINKIMQLLAWDPPADTSLYLLTPSAMKPLLAMARAACYTMREGQVSDNELSTYLGNAQLKLFIQY